MTLSMPQMHHQPQSAEILSDPDHLFLTDPFDIALSAAAETITPPPNADYLQWAIDNVKFGKPIPGPYNPAKFPFFNEPLRALSPSDPCRIVTMRKSAQIGGTVLGWIFMGASMHLTVPELFIDYHPSRDAAKDAKTNKFDPFVENAPILKTILNTEGNKGAKSNGHQLQRFDKRGSLMFLGAGSDKTLSSHSAPHQIQDDLSKWETLDSGDSETMADTRSQAYEHDAKILKVSTPLIWPGCRITNNFLSSSREFWEIPCNKCGKYYRLEWEVFLEICTPDNLDHIQYPCPNCSGVLKNHELYEFNQWGRYFAEKPEQLNFHRGFSVWSAYSPLFSWSRLMREWFKAKGDSETEKAFKNDKVGLAFEIESSTPDHEWLYDWADENAKFDQGVIPPEAAFIMCGIDCQGDRVEWHIVGVGPGFRTFPFDYGIIDHHISTPEAAAEIKKLLNRTWPDTWGRRRGLDHTAIDSSAYSDEVYNIVKAHPDDKIIAIKGRGTEDYSIKPGKWYESGFTGRLRRTTRHLWLVGTWYLKMDIMEKLKLEDPRSPGFVTFARGFEKDYFEQLTAERRVGIVNKSTGYKVFKWEVEKGRRNEVLDTYVYAVAAARRLGLHKLRPDEWDYHMAERCSPPPEHQGGLFDPERIIKTAASQNSQSETAVVSAPAPPSKPVDPMDAIRAMARRAAGR